MCKECTKMYKNVHTCRRDRTYKDVLRYERNCTSMYKDVLRYERMHNEGITRMHKDVLKYERMYKDVRGMKGCTRMY